MSAAERWRPRAVRTTGSVMEAIYGLILATSVIAVSRGATWGWAPKKVTDRMYGATGDHRDMGG
jgi:hypothetical protein